MNKIKDKTVLNIQSMQDVPPAIAPIKGKPDRIEYSMTFRIPRGTADRLQEMARLRRTTLQALIAEAVDRWLRAEGEGHFYPEGFFEARKKSRKSST